MFLRNKNNTNPLEYDKTNKTEQSNKNDYLFLNCRYLLS